VNIASGRPPALRSFSGDLLRGGDAGYDDARAVHNGMIDKRPALIARCRSAADVAAALRYAAPRELELSVRGGGHNVAGTGVTDGGVMIDLAPMRRVVVDATSARARAEGGVTWGELDTTTQRHGLAVTGGMISSTGVAGLTLGGGLGWLMGKHGLSCDNLISAEVVLADGSVVQASDDEHPDLFWGLRGGGGNFGVVTSFEYRLHPVGPRVTGVRAAYAWESAADVLRRYREVTSSGPDELTANAALTHAPDGSGVKVAAVIGCHLGEPTAAERELAAFGDLPAAVVVDIGPVDYCELNSVLDANYPRGALNYWKSTFLSELSDEAIDTLVSLFATCPSAGTSFVIENLHGAVTRVPVGATAVPHRAPGYNLVITSVWHDAAASEENIAWTRNVFDAMRPFSSATTYSNYLADDELEGDPVARAFGPNYARLVEVKNAYDPTNLFRLNQNIRPTG
jgi:FAD/FMN-containing dehydrogenase